MTAVFKKEFKSSLFGMTGPIFIFAVLLILGFFTMFYVFVNASTHFEYAIVDGAFWSLILTPILTMRSFSEERKTKTDQLLYSLPITTAQIVLGKYLAMVAVFAIPCAVSALYPVIASFFAGGGMNFAICYGALLAYFLLGCALIAVCMLISSLFESQVIVAILSLAVTLFLNFLSSVVSVIPTEPFVSVVALAVIALVAAYIVYASTKNYIATAVVGVVLLGAIAAVYFVDSSLYVGLLSNMISSIFIFQPIATFANGVFDITCFIYYLSIAALFVFVTVQSFERRRWN